MWLLAVGEISVRSAQAGGLKETAAIADIPGTMTVSTITTLDEWAAHPFGKARTNRPRRPGSGIGCPGPHGGDDEQPSAWLLVLLGVALAATSVRAAPKPSVIRLTTLAAVMVSVLYIGQTF